MAYSALERERRTGGSRSNLGAILGGTALVLALAACGLVLAKPTPAAAPVPKSKDDGTARKLAEFQSSLAGLSEALGRAASSVQSLTQKVQGLEADVAAARALAAENRPEGTAGVEVLQFRQEKLGSDLQKVSLEFEGMKKGLESLRTRFDQVEAGVQENEKRIEEVARAGASSPSAGSPSPAPQPEAPRAGGGQNPGGRGGGRFPQGPVTREQIEEARRRMEQSGMTPEQIDRIIKRMEERLQKP